MKTRCKFVCSKIEDNMGHETSRVVYFETRYCPEVEEDIRFTKYTPWGNMRVCIDNPVVLEQLKEGKEYYIDISSIKN